MVRCASSFSSPPKVCTTCVNEYIAFKQAEYDLHRLTNVTSLDSTPCARVIYSNYIVSYVSEISDVVNRRIWDQSRCSSCVNINWELEKNATMYAYTKSVYNFEKKLFDWRHCVMNYSLEANELYKNYSTVCENCLTSFNSLFHFYWDVYVTPGIDFCLDVETTMNDTMNVWHNVWGCADDSGHDRQRDWTFVLFSVVILTALTSLFYVGSYVQSERAHRTLVQYSRLEAPGRLRSRILSASAIADEFAQQQASSQQNTSDTP
uniref:Osteopetrosis-associated transmembrane protein 1 n=1 Tax=Ascaris suum TaxID=6253 RepID=F1L5F5_ASCSU